MTRVQSIPIGGLGWSFSSLWLAINWRHRQIHHFGTSSQSYSCDRWWHIQFPSTFYNITNLSFLFHGGGRIWLRPTFPLQSLQYTFLLITNSRYIVLCFPIPITDPDCLPIIEISLCLVIPELPINIILIIINSINSLASAIEPPWLASKPCRLVVRVQEVRPTLVAVQSVCPP